MNVVIIGCGYVGLTTGVSLAHLGHHVSFVDVDEQRLTALRNGVAPFFEPGLQELLHAVRERCRFTSDYAEALTAAEVVFLAVGTPSTPAGHANLTYLYDAVTALGRALPDPAPLIVVKSTVPVGTTREVQRLLTSSSGRAAERPVAVASNPEFLRQGRALSDSLAPERIVIGCDDARSRRTLERLYARLLRRDVPPAPGLPLPASVPAEVPLLHTSPESAELAKYAANAFLATKISFANEIANLCDAVSADIDEVVEVLGHDRRIGGDFLRAGLGYGGSCFPKDTRALAYVASRGGYNFTLLRAVIEVNNAQRFRAIEKLEQVLGRLHGMEIALLGLTFKPGTDDLREAPSLEIAQELLLRGARVRAHDPMVPDAAKLGRGRLPREFASRIAVAATPTAALDGADAGLLVTEWPHYRRLDWADLRLRMRRPVFIDGRNALDPELMVAAGFIYQGIGRRLREPERQPLGREGATLHDATLHDSRATLR